MTDAPRPIVQSGEPDRWKPILDDELALIEAAFNEGRLSDLVSVRRFVLLRLAAEIRRRGKAPKPLPRVYTGDATFLCHGDRETCHGLFGACVTARRCRLDGGGP